MDADDGKPSMSNSSPRVNASFAMWLHCFAALATCAAVLPVVLVWTPARAVSRAVLHVSLLIGVALVLASGYKLPITGPQPSYHSMAGWFLVAAVFGLIVAKALGSHWTLDNNQFLREKGYAKVLQRLFSLARRFFEWILLPFLLLVTVGLALIAW